MDLDNGTVIDNLMDNTLSEQELLDIDGRKFRTVEELAGHMRNKLDTSLEAFVRLCHKLVDYDGKLDAQFEAWLINIGKKEELENWRASL